MDIKIIHLLKLRDAWQGPGLCKVADLETEIDVLCEENLSE